MQSNDNNKNRGTHGDSSFMLGGLPSSSENPPASAVGSVNETRKEDMSVIDQAFERGYQQGYRHGVEDQKNEAVWNLPDVIPEDGELVQVIHLPYNWRTRRMCKRRGIQWLMTNGIFLSGDKLWEENHEPEEPWDEEEWPDALLITPKVVVAWKDVILLWHSAEVPDWFVEKYKGEGDSC